MLEKTKNNTQKLEGLSSLTSNQTEENKSREGIAGNRTVVGACQN